MIHTEHFRQNDRKPNIAIPYFGIGTNSSATNRKLFTVVLNTEK